MIRPARSNAAYRRALSGLVWLVVAAACGSATGGTPLTADTVSAPSVTLTPSTVAAAPNSSSIATPATTRSSTSTTIVGTSSTSLPASSTSLPVPEGLPITIERGISVEGGIPMDVFSPLEPGPWPAVVLLHGGGWIGGDKEDVEPFATTLAEQGLVVFNAGYRTLVHGVFFPETFEQAACAVNAALSMAGDYQADPARVTVVGYSAGAHIGALATLAPNVFDDPCEPAHPAPPIAGFVGIAGPYDSDLFPQLLVNFGASLEDDPDAWALANPYTYLGNNPELDVLLLQGTTDIVVAPLNSERFFDALTAASYQVVLSTRLGAGHFDILDPSTDGVWTAQQVVEHVRGISEAN